MKLEKLLYDFQEEAWSEFHWSKINDSDDFYQYMHDYIDNSVIYNHDCVEYLTNNEEYYFLNHDLYGRPNNINQAAYACIYDYFINNDVFDLWNEMEKVLNESLENEEA